MLLNLVLGLNLVVKNVLRQLVVPLGARSDDGAGDTRLVICHKLTSRKVKLIEDGVCQTINVRVERAECLRQQPRQHGEDTVHEVRGGAPLQRLLVKVGALRHEVRDVCDMNADLVDGSTDVVDR